MNQKIILGLLFISLILPNLNLHEGYTEEIPEDISFHTFELENDIQFGEKLEGSLRFGFRRTPNGKELFGLFQLANNSLLFISYKINVQLFDKNKELITEDKYIPLKPLAPDGLNASSLNFHLSVSDSEKIAFYTLQYSEKI